MLEKPRVLVIDDELQLLEIVYFALETQGFVVTTANDIASAEVILAENDYDLIVLDVMLPDGMGFNLCKTIRAKSNVPIIMLTARGEYEDRELGFESGADDYVVKPFHPRELALRAQAIAGRYLEMRRLGKFTIGEVCIDPKNATVTVKGKLVFLSQSEFRLLSVLASASGKLIDAETILSEVWGIDASSGGKEILKTAIYRLRIKLGDDGDESRYIHTVRGHGYTLDYNNM
jgi:DNA-binding response OmpR family regulator